MDVPRFSLPIGFIIGLMLGNLLLATPSWAELKCGDMIGPNEVATLTKDLVCSEGLALTVQQSSILNLGGHSVDCDHFGTGILVQGPRGTLENGKITHCQNGVVIEGSGNIVRDVTVTQSLALDDPQCGFCVAGSGNFLTHNFADGGAFGFFLDGSNSGANENEISYNTSTKTIQGFLIFGSRNLIKKNLAIDNQGGFASISNPSLGFGNDNTFIKNRAISSVIGFEDDGCGFNLQGNRTKVIENLAKDNARNGFVIGGADPKVLSNRAIGNEEDGFQFQTGTGYIVLGNIAKRNNSVGINLNPGATDSTLLGNVALRNGAADLRDQNLNCDDNTWKGNFFLKNDPPRPSCIE